MPAPDPAITSAAPIAVLCFDDNPMLTATLGMRLSFEPDLRWLEPRHRLDDALSLIASLEPDVVLLDLGIPGSDRPLDVLAALQTRGLRAGAIVLTGRTDADTQRAVLEAGARGFVSKSVAPERLIDAIRRVAVGETVVALDA